MTKPIKNVIPKEKAPIRELRTVSPGPAADARQYLLWLQRQVRTTHTALDQKNGVHLCLVCHKAERCPFNFNHVSQGVCAFCKRVLQRPPVRDDGRSFFHPAPSPGDETQQKRKGISDDRP
jgi:hypothetical protein